VDDQFVENRFAVVDGDGLVQNQPNQLHGIGIWAPCREQVNLKAMLPALQVLVYRPAGVAPVLVCDPMDLPVPAQPGAHLLQEGEEQVRRPSGPRYPHQLPAPPVPSS